MANTTDKSILTAAGKALLAQLNAEEKPLIIDKMIFAYVPNRPEFPQPDDVVPTDNVVHQEGVEQRGRLSADSVIYSTTLTSDVGPFEFNWTGAYCSEYGVLVTIDHHALTPKTADEPGVAGNTLVRSVVLEYKDIAEITNITVDASTWQYNATPRMKKMDDDVAQAIIDQNGKDWFIEDGFLVTPQASAFNIKAGAGYVSGNRVTLEFDRNVQVPNKPSFIYVDAHREGTPTGEQITLFDFVVTAEEKGDYTDANGVKHFVCKIAQVLADGSVSDLRPEGENKTWVKEQILCQNNQIVGGNIWPVSGHLSLGEQSTRVDVGITRLRVKIGSAVEILRLWEPSGDFETTSHVITKISAPEVGLKGYIVTTNQGSFEFITERTEKLRLKQNLEGWGVPTGHNDTAAFQNAYDYVMNSNNSLGGTIKFKGYWYLTTLNTYSNENKDFDGKPSNNYTFYASRGGPIPHVELEGETRANSQIKSVNGDPLFIPSAELPSAFHEFHVRNCSLVGFNKQGTPLELNRANTYPYRYIFNNCSFINWEYGYKYNRFEGEPTANPIHGYFKFVDCQFSANRVGVKTGGDNAYFENCWITYNDWCNLWTHSGSVLTVKGGKIEYLNLSGWDDWEPPIVGNLVGPFIWLCSTGVESLNFDGVYFEPKSSSSGNNVGYVPFAMYKERELEVIANISFTNGSRINGLGSTKLLYVDSHVAVEGLDLSSLYIRNFKLSADMSLIAVNNLSYVKSFVSVGSRVSDISDQTGLRTHFWQMFSDESDVRLSSDASKNAMMTSSLKNNSVLKIEAHVKSNSSVYFGDGFSVSKISTGIYEIKLDKQNLGGENKSFFYASAAPDYRGYEPEQYDARVEYISSNTLRIHVYIGDTTNRGDSSFTFSATIGTL
tara:strand:- start:2411 stop:5086 length:2676 start_codon:yes stop_codon:yes gene_type:complete